MFDIYTLTLIFFLLSACMILWVVYSIRNFNYDSIEVLNQVNIKQGVVLLLEYNTMKYLSWDVKPSVVINNRVFQRKWGAHEIDLDPGEYIVEIYFSYMGIAQCGKKSISFELKNNEVKRIEYKAPLIVSDKGKISIKTEELV